MESRIHPFLYRIKKWPFSFFLDYGNKKKIKYVYEFIQLGRVVKDVTVIDLWVLKYCLNGIIFYKINYGDVFKELSRKLKTIAKNQINIFPKRYHTSKKITWQMKWFTKFKKTMSYDCYSFYDCLPHMETSIRKEKQQNKKWNLKIFKDWYIFFLNLLNINFNNLIIFYILFDLFNNFNGTFYKTINSYIIILLLLRFWYPILWFVLFYFIIRSWKIQLKIIISILFDLFLSELDDFIRLLLYNINILKFTFKY